MSFERYFPVGCWKEGKPRPCSRKRLWNCVRASGVPHLLSVCFAAGHHQGLQRSLSLSEENEKTQCVCLIWDDEWEERALSAPTVIIFS